MRLVALVFLFLSSSLWAQTEISKELTFGEYLGYVKKFHPLVKSANLIVSEAQANLMMARGAFDPKIDVDFDQKKFKGSEYYSILNSSFKIPTWYGIEIKAGFDNYDGIYLNPQNTVPNQGLTSVGISVPLGQGLLINQRMADLRRAKIQIRMSEAERNLEAVSVLYDASIAYFNWSRCLTEVNLYRDYLGYAQERYKGMIILIEQGDKPAVDSIEAGIVVRNRELSLEDASLKLAKAKLELSNFLWLENNIPLELQDDIVPETNLEETIQQVLMTNDYLIAPPMLETHPKILTLQNKIDLLDIDRRLRANLLLPRIDLDYSYISQPQYFDNYRLQDYKVGLNFSFALFLRKERGNLQITKFRLQDATFDLELERLQIRNKIVAQQTEISSLQRQKDLIERLVSDNSAMLRAEERLFSLGESSIFLINVRENNLVSAQLSKLSIDNRYFNSHAALYLILGNP